MYTKLIVNWMEIYLIFKIDLLKKNTPNREYSILYLWYQKSFSFNLYHTFRIIVHSGTSDCMERYRRNSCCFLGHGTNLYKLLHQPQKYSLEQNPSFKKFNTISRLMIRRPTTSAASMIDSPSVSNSKSSFPIPGSYSMNDERTPSIVRATFYYLSLSAKTFVTPRRSIFRSRFDVEWFYWIGSPIR